MSVKRSSDIVEAARESLGAVGAFLPNPFGTPWPPVADQRQAVRRLEAAGYPSAWINEGIGGRDVFVQSALLLAATDRLTIGTAVANIWAREPSTTHAAMALLADAYPHRAVLGIGVGYPFQAQVTGRTYEHPVATMRAYLERLTEELPGSPVPEVRYPRIVAANGPYMLALSGSHGDGALPTVVSPGFTAQARAALGHDKLLVLGVTVAVDDDRAVAKEAARQFIVNVSGASGFARANLLRLGFTPEQLASGDEAVVDAIVPYGTADDVARGVREHLDAGADHVRLGIIGEDFDSAIADFERLAPFVLT